MDVTAVTKRPITPSGWMLPQTPAREFLRTGAYIYIYMNNHTLIHVHIQIHIYMYTHTYTYIHNKLGLDSRRPTPDGVYCDTAVVCNQSILLLDGLSYRTDEHHLPRVTGFKALVTHLMSPLLSEKTGPPGFVTSHTRRPGVGLGCQWL